MSTTRLTAVVLLAVALLAAMGCTLRNGEQLFRSGGGIRNLAYTAGSVATADIEDLYETCKQDGDCFRSAIADTILDRDSAGEFYAGALTDPDLISDTQLAEAFDELEANPGSCLTVSQNFFQTGPGPNPPLDSEYELHVRTGDSGLGCPELASLYD